MNYYELIVNSTPTNTARTELHSMITFHHANTRGSRAGRLRIAHLCVLKQLSSTCHVSSHAVCDTDHKHKFSLTYLTYLSDNLTHTFKTFGTLSIFTLRSSTAERRISTNPISRRLWAQGPQDRSNRAWKPWAQKNWAWEEFWDRSVSNTRKIYEKQLPKSYRWRYGWIWKSWCRDVLHRVIDAFRLWLSGTAKNAGFTSVYAKSRGP